MQDINRYPWKNKKKKKQYGYTGSKYQKQRFFVRCRVGSKANDDDVNGEKKGEK
jgi:hypothetical protein